MKNFSSIIFIFYLFSFIKCLTIPKKKNLKSNNLNYNLTEEYAEINSELAIKRIKELVPKLNDTSCKVSAKFILLAISSVYSKKDLPVLKLKRGDLNGNLEKIKEKINQNYILQIETRANHHFVVFRKNNQELYLLQSFKFLFILKEWINDEDIIKPYLTIDEFIDNFRIMLDFNSTKEERDNSIIKLFLPPLFTNNKEIKRKLIKWFYGNHVLLYNVNYVTYHFSNIENPNDFIRIFKIVNATYDIAEHYYNY